MQPNLNNLIHLFEEMTTSGFEISGPLKWGFFFIDKSKKKLLSVFCELEDHHYTLESLEKRGRGYWQLAVSKIDVLTPESLHRRNIAFNVLAQACKVEVYDGWDVERQPG